MKKLYRSSNRVFGGVCGGIAEYFDVDATLVRVIYTALTIFSAAFPGFLLYLIMLLIMPVAPIAAGSGTEKEAKVEDVPFEEVKKEGTKKED